MKTVSVWGGIIVGLTDIELAVQLQAGVALGGGGADLPVLPVQLQRRLLHVALGNHAMPLVVVERRGRAHAQLHRPVPHVEGEGDDGGPWGREGDGMEHTPGLTWLEYELAGVKRTGVFWGPFGDVERRT